METDTYSSAEVAAHHASNFISVKLDGDKQSAFSVSIYPTTFVVSADGEVLGSVDGYCEPAPYLEALKKIDAHRRRLSELLPIEKKTLENRKEIASLYRELNLSAKAAEAFRGVVDHADADRPSRARAYLALLELVPGAALIDEVKKFDPDNASDLLDDAAFAEVALLAQAREFDRVVDIGRAAYEKFSKSDRADCLLFQVAMACRRLGKKDESLRALRELVEKHPETGCGKRAAGMLPKQD